MQAPFHVCPILLSIHLPANDLKTAAEDCANNGTPDIHTEILMRLLAPAWPGVLTVAIRVVTQHMKHLSLSAPSPHYKSDFEINK